MKTGEDVAPATLQGRARVPARRENVSKIFRSSETRDQVCRGFREQLIARTRSLPAMRRVH
jgi:hypothetical protein